MKYGEMAQTIVRLIEVAEDTYRGQKGKGRTKKASVMTYVREVVTDMSAAGTGRRDLSWAEAEPIVGNFVDAAVRLCNLFSGEEMPDQGPEWMRIVGTL